MDRETSTKALDGAVTAMAVGRIIWGIAAYAAPGANTKAAGLPGRPSGEVTYLTRVFGSRAFALGCGYLLSDDDAKSRWRRLGLVVDVSDTAAGVVHLVRGDVPRRATATLVAATGTYAAIGALRVAKELRSAS
ncbi:hypothetical protein [Solicola gregarius]|uniref:DUF4267 domain-containing protein n=1 Tax=Solicola gregarius TaxID=2908642 RepID=A0AA46THF9_9ACTN|nr:hypothetical protein [Solicola gregarius]UYM04892.1 hypothetical protein L0C25_20565 [Solicola gregarius]